MKAWILCKPTRSRKAMPVHAITRLIVRFCMEFWLFCIYTLSKYPKTHKPPAPPTCAITCAIMLLPFFANRHQHANMRRPQFLPYFMCKLMQFHKISQECPKNVADNYCTRFVHNTHALAQNSLKDFTWINIPLNLYFFHFRLLSAHTCL